MLCNGYWNEEEIKVEIKKYLETNKQEDKSYQNF